MHTKPIVPRLALLTLALGAALPAHAEEEVPAINCTGTLTLASDYRFRGLTQTNEDPALQGSIECAHASGFYAGLWASNVSWLSDLSSADLPISSSLEIDYYAGYRMSFAEGWGLDVGAYGYYYPGDYPRGFTRPYTTEVFAGVTYDVVGVKYWHTVTNAFGFADSHNSGYLEANYNPVLGAGWTLNLHAGHQRIDGSDDFDYTDWKVGVTKDLGRGFSFAVAYIDSNADEDLYLNPYGEELGDATVVVSLAKAF
jgi:uncharacterized protein (TIGR02001 family)